MITLIHGEDTAASRNYYFTLKKELQELVHFDGTTTTVDVLQQAISGEDLFGTKKDICIENLISKRKNAKDVELLTNLLKSTNTNIVLWEGKELTRKQTELLGNATIKLFKIPSTVFALLDALKPNNGKQLIELFHKTLNDKDGEFVLVMLQRQIRILLALFEKSDNTISETARLAPWQKSKLEKQCAFFSKEQLVDLHHKLFQLELGMKTGGLSLPVSQEIDFIFATL